MEKENDLKLGDTVMLIFREQYRVKGFINYFSMSWHLNKEYDLIGINTNKDAWFFIDKHIILTTRIVLTEKYKG